MGAGMNAPAARARSGAARSVAGSAAAGAGPGTGLGMERSFAREVEKLRLGAGEIFEGEAIVAVTKAILQAGVSYVGGYPGAPVSHLMDVLAEARAPVLEPMGITFEQSASEAGAAALLGASINYPLRGAVTWKSIVGTNVASDALSNVASAGVTGGALIIVGEDYGEGASVIQERTHATALKSSIPLLDPRYDMPRLVELTETAFELSEAARLPVIMSLRIRAAHMTGAFVCKDNRAPKFGPHHPLPRPVQTSDTIVLPPASYAQERDKFDTRLPAAQRFIVARGINEIVPGRRARLGIVLQGGTHGSVVRALRLLGATRGAEVTAVPLLVLNAIHPLVPDQIADFVADKEAVLVVEEGNPPFIEREIREILHRRGLPCRLRGKDILPMAGEYTLDVVRRGIGTFLVEEDGGADGLGRAAQAALDALEAARAETRAVLDATAPPPRPPSFCTGCPERPVFTALKLLQRERGPLHISSDIGCNTFSTLPPFNTGSTVLGYGLSLASGGAVAGPLNQPAVAVMGDGGFWHGGLTTGAANAHWNGHDSVLVVLENGYASATGQQHVPSTGSTAWGRPVKLSIERVLRGMGIGWIRRVNAYHVAKSLRVLRAALDARGQGLRVVISDEECMLARQRRERRLQAARLAAGKPVIGARFGVDEEVCSGDHSCMRLSGCPSLTLRRGQDPLKDGPAAMVDASCVACGLCGAAAHAAALCPSFYRAQTVRNPGPLTRLRHRLESALLRIMGAT
ncbi:MAG: indolepyruvate ferredoxin oxidoreductase subunit alpha [Roseovarius sp.]